MRPAGFLAAIAMGTLLNYLVSGSLSAEPNPPPPANAQQPSAQDLETWRKSMHRTPTPRSGCFTSTFPSGTWQEIPCTTAPNRPFQSNSGAGPNAVGSNTGDFSAQVSGSLSSATGSLSVSDVTSKSDPNPASFSLQINTNRFSTSNLQTTLCNNQSGCVAWQQFVYSNKDPSGFCPSSNNSHSCVFIQYWLVNHASPCPTSPTVANNTWSFAAATATSASGCFINGNATPVPDQTIAGLNGLTLTGATSSGSQSITLDVSLQTSPGVVAAVVYNASDTGDMLGTGSNWNIAEFNIFGNGNSRQAQFLPNPGSTIVVKTIVENGSPFPPICSQTGFTANRTI